MSEGITITWRDGRLAVLHATVLANTDRQGTVFGDKGFLVIDNINNCARIDLYNMNRELVESSGYEGMHAIYWDSSWKVTEPNLNTPYLGIIYQGTVDGMRRTDVLVLRYGRGDDKGELLYRLQTESYEAR